MNYFGEAIAWLTTGANWNGTNGIAHRLIEHTGYTLSGVAIAALIAIPLGLIIGHSGIGRSPVIRTTASIRALPTLGVLTIAGLSLGIGLSAPMVAFVILAIPTILAGTYSGIESVNRATVDAAYAQGMTRWQVLTQVQIPLGAPLIIGGLRSATLQVVATATLAAYVGAGGLGRYLFYGLKTYNYALMVACAILVIALAIAFEMIFVTLAKIARNAIGVQTKENSL